MMKLTNDEEALSILQGLVSKAHSKEYQDQIVGPKKTIIEVLKELKIVPTLSDFVILCPRISVPFWLI